MVAADLSNPIASESALARLWRDSHLRPHHLETADGTRYRVIHPGVQSSEAGPDFRAAILVDHRGRRLLGDIELHRAAGEWYNHRHHLDANYNGVVIHVVLRRGAHGSSRQASGTEVPVAELIPQATQGADDVAAAAAPSPRPPERIADELDRLGDLRFLERSRGLVMSMKADADPDQMLYEGVMEALGYASNRKPFRQLAGLVPYRALRNLRGEPRFTRLAGIEAVLLWGAGLLDGQAPSARSRQLRRMVRGMDWRQGRRLARRGEWKLFRVRPTNHPVRRISGIAAVLARTMDAGLGASLESALMARGAKGTAAAFLEPPLIGADRAAEIVLNVVLPYFNARGVLSGDTLLARKSLDEYRQAAPLSGYGSSGRFAMSLGIDADRSLMTTSRRQQGLLHLQKHLAGAIDEPGGLRLPALTGG